MPAIMYHFTFIPFIRHSAIIYMYYHFMSDQTNMYMLKLSRDFHDEVYENVKPRHKGFRYYIAKFIVGDIGKCLLANYARFIFCSLDGNRKNSTEYKHHYQLLPNSYRKRLVDD